MASRGVNEVTILGRLGADPDKIGEKGCKFSVATNKDWTDKDGNKQEKTSWHNIVTWGKLADICSLYLAKGKQVYVKGELDYRVWEKEDGTKGYATDIVAYSVQFIGGDDNKGKVKNHVEDIPF